MSKVVGMGGNTNGPGPARINLRPEEMNDYTCEECNSRVFRQVSLFKHISALVSPTGQEQMIPIPTYRCDDCGHINEDMMVPAYGK